jgi:hypothetical protein
MAKNTCSELMHTIDIIIEKFTCRSQFCALSSCLLTLSILPHASASEWQRTKLCSNAAISFEHPRSLRGFVQQRKMMAAVGEI